MMTPRQVVLLLVLVSVLMLVLMIGMLLQGCGDLYSDTGYPSYPSSYGSLDGCEIQSESFCSRLFAWEGERIRCETKAIPRCRSKGCYSLDEYGTKPSCSAMWRELSEELTG